MPLETSGARAERLSASPERYAYWDGARFGPTTKSPALAEERYRRTKDFKRVTSPSSWRGLLQDPAVPRTWLTDATMERQRRVILTAFTEWCEASKGRAWPRSDEMTLPGKTIGVCETQGRRSGSGRCVSHQTLAIYRFNLQSFQLLGEVWDNNLMPACSPNVVCNIED